MVDKDEKILNAVKTIIRAELDKLKYNYYLEGKITADNLDGTYEVLIRDESYNLKPKDNSTYLVGDLVMVLVPNSDFGRKLIDFVRP